MRYYIPKHRQKSRLKKLLAIVKYSAMVFFGISLFLTLLFKRLNPSVTPLMILRGIQTKKRTYEQTRVPISSISDDKIYVVLAGEDNQFLKHFGFDIAALISAVKLNIIQGKKSAGGSTITQQTAKNVFLRPARSYIRKVFEIYYSVLMEIIWGKKRILEVYLNVAEFGTNLYGVEAAAQKYFQRSISELSIYQFSFLVAILPNPRYYEGHLNDRSIVKRKASIIRSASSVKKDKDSKNFVKEIKK